jgi:putative flippase GtrA
MTTGIRWLKFNTVGAIGIAVQLDVLAMLRSVNHLEAIQRMLSW